MCGIVGMFDTQGRREAPVERLRRMNASQLHRGPDEGGELFAPGVALGHRRLSIIDLSSGQQPMYNHDGSVAIVYNGEIYNFPELTKELTAAGYRFKTHSDTEVVIHAWEAWGEECVKRFNGMFAFAVWDSNRQSLFLGRDRLGKKPLYYTTVDGWLCFASELKSLMTLPGIERRMDVRAIEDYFAYGYVPDPRTILRSVHKLAPAHTLLAERGKVHAPREYWDVAFKANGARPPAEIQEELLHRLREAVRIRLMSEVPLGAFLSGGVDSSAVVAMMAGLSADPVNTCSISFGDPKYNESQYALQVAKQFGTRHNVEQVDPADFDLLDRLATVYDEPFADSSAIPTYRVCQLARRHVTVALSGDGGDETFAGYRRYPWHMREERVRSVLPLGVRRSVFGTLGRLYPRIDWAPKYLRAKSTLESLGWDSLQGYFHSVSIIADRVRLPMYTPEFREQLQGYHALEVLQKHAERAPTRDPLSLVQYLDLKTYLPGDILVKVDRAAMANSLEVRVPILDYTFIDWASGLPAALKLHQGEGKYVFKKSLEPVLPREVLYRDKMGFAVPIAQWFRGPLQARMRETLLSGGLMEMGILDRSWVEALIKQHQSGRKDHSAALWALLMFGSCTRQLGATLA
jgi:asparagine synthase (glutamine-hydrolysing)